jgi:hypothetical protein
MSGGFCTIIPCLEAISVSGPKILEHLLVMMVTCSSMAHFDCSSASSRIPRSVLPTPASRVPRSENKVDPFQLPLDFHNDGSCLLRGLVLITAPATWRLSLVLKSLPLTPRLPSDDEAVALFNLTSQSPPEPASRWHRRSSNTIYKWQIQRAT